MSENDPEMKHVRVGIAGLVSAQDVLMFALLMGKQEGITIDFTMSRAAKDLICKQFIDKKKDPAGKKGWEKLNDMVRRSTGYGIDVEQKTARNHPENTHAFLLFSTVATIGRLANATPDTHLAGPFHQAMGALQRAEALSEYTGEEATAPDVIIGAMTNTYQASDAGFDRNMDQLERRGAKVFYIGGHDPGTASGIQSQFTWKFFAQRTCQSLGRNFVDVPGIGGEPVFVVERQGTLAQTLARQEPTSNKGFGIVAYTER